MFIWGGGRRRTEWQGLGERVTLTQGQVRLWNIPRFYRFFVLLWRGYFTASVQRHLPQSVFWRFPLLPLKTLTMRWYSDDRTGTISLSHLSESTFIIQCDKLTGKMSVKFYTYMNFCVTSPSVHLFVSESIAEGFFVPGSSALCFQAFKQIALRTSEFVD